MSVVAGFLLPHLSPVVIDDIDCVDGAAVIAAHPRARGSWCRRCGRVSRRVHSRCRRQLADLPVAGRPVEVWLTARRFFCDHVDCSAWTFVEQVPGLAERHAPPVPWDTAAAGRSVLVVRQAGPGRVLARVVYVRVADGSAW